MTAVQSRWTDDGATDEPWRRAPALVPSLVDYADDAILVIDASSLRILDANAAACRQSGYSRHELRWLAMTDLTAADAAIAERLGGQLADGEVVRFETRQRRPLRITSMLNAIVKVSGRHLGTLCLEHVDQPHHWHEDEIAFACRMGDKIAVALGCRAEREAQLALAVSERRFRTLFDRAPVGMARMTPDGRCQQVNDALGRILGRAPHELVGEPLPGFDRIEEGRVQVSYVTPDQRSIWADVVVAPVRNEAEAVESLVAVVQDVTEMKESEHALRAALRGTITALSAAAEKRDPYTAGHQRRVAQLSAAIASELGLAHDRVEGVFLAAQIHDIGKLYVPSEVLTRTGALTGPESDMVRTHAQVGWEIIRDVRFPWPIADVVEAMTSHRPYRPARLMADAMLEVECHRGTLYDASVVDACLRLIREKGFTFEPGQDAAAGS